jgi:hypothetical protein
MEYGEIIDSDNINLNTQRYVGYHENNVKGLDTLFFKEKTLRLISTKVSELLQGVDPKNRTYIVPDYIIRNIMDDVFTNYRPPVGDIYSRFIIPSNDADNNNLQSLINQTIEIIVYKIRTEAGMIEANKKLTVFTTILGDFNQHGLRGHSVIKVRHRKPDTMQFNMHY